MAHQRQRSGPTTRIGCIPSASHCLRGPARGEHRRLAVPRGPRPTRHHGAPWPGRWQASTVISTKSCSTIIFVRTRAGGWSHRQRWNQVTKRAGVRAQRPRPLAQHLSLLPHLVDKTAAMDSQAARQGVGLATWSPTCGPCTTCRSRLRDWWPRGRIRKPSCIGQGARNTVREEIPDIARLHCQSRYGSAGSREAILSRTRCATTLYAPHSRSVGTVEFFEESLPRAWGCDERVGNNC